MIYSKGKTLAVGQTVAFDTWDDKAKNGPARVPQKGKVESLTGHDREDQSKGDVTVRIDKELVTVPALSVSVVS